MTDLVERQAVLDLTWEEPSYTDALNVLTEIRDKVKALPSVTPTERTGHWIDHQEDRWIYAKCSECGSVHDTQSNYCPSCGCLMDRWEADECDI